MMHRDRLLEMMDVGLYIAAQGMLAEQVRQDQLASDLSNSSTPGYKSQTSVQESFGSMLLSNGVGSIQTGVKIASEVPNLSQGTLQATGNPLNFAIAGQGFFAVRTAQGVQYTRDGQFSANAQGVLVDQLGDPVLSQSGATIQVGADGTTPATSLGVFNLTTPTQIGNNNFTGTVGGKGTGTVEAGQLEGSGVDPIETMVDMTTSLDSYQAGQRAIETINQTMQESSATVGLVGGA